MHYTASHWQVMSSRRLEEIRDADHVLDKWSQNSATCCASTSRGRSNSSGDCDEDNEQESDRCSACDSRAVYISQYCEIPCKIVDSTARIRKSKWNTFKDYLIIRKNRIRILGKKLKRKGDDKQKK